MSNRKKTPKTTEKDVLVKSKRRCCICFFLNGNDNRKKGQIAHLDGDPSNYDEDNLAFICLDHHDEYDSKTSQSKGITIEEIKHYRDQLYTFQNAQHKERKKQDKTLIKGDSNVKMDDNIREKAKILDKGIMKDLKIHANKFKKNIDQKDYISFGESVVKATLKFNKYEYFDILDNSSIFKIKDNKISLTYQTIPSPH